MESNKVLKNLTKIQIEKLNDVFKEKSYKAGEVMLKKGEIGMSKLCIILKGSIKYVTHLLYIK